MSLSRHTANRIARKFACAMSAGLTLLALSSASASAGTQLPLLAPEVAPSCASQTFSQPFAALNDGNYYTLVPGSEFNGSSEGWTLANGAHVIQTTRPDGTNGGALDMPAGSIAVSPPVCVTLLYASARIWERGGEGASVSVSVAYAGTHSATKPKKAGRLQSEGEGQGWTLSEPFEVRPELGGNEEGSREVRFVFIASGKGHSQLYGLYLDPWMR
jgi:hypothetical protein